MVSKVKRISRLFLLVFVSIIGYSVIGPIGWSEAEASTSAIIKIPESRDFATVVLGNPWDMNEFSDISQYLNRSGQADYLKNISVAGGIFSATGNEFVNPDNGKLEVDPQFFPLYPGYVIGIPTGNIGNVYPIQSAVYHCLHISMKVDSDKSDGFQIFWFQDEHLNGGKWGYSTFQVPEPLVWKLYKVDLGTSYLGGGTSWPSNPTWEGIRIDPTAKKVNFAVDWVRLTDCSPVKLPSALNWSGGTANIYIKPQGTTREILLESNKSSPFNPDFQGVAPGVYDVLIRSSNNGSLLQTTPVEINQTFTADFKTPSFTSGQDYATTAGNAWDFAGSPDVKSTSCITSSNYDPAGYFRFVTRQGNVQPAGCWTSDPMGLATDSKIYLNLPGVLQPSEYRYLTYRLKTESPIQNIPEGMIVRWIWTTDSYSRPNQGFRCHMVSQLIAYDVGWQTYSIDLFDPFNGSVVQTAGDCPAANTLSWQTSKPVLELRFDPNENIALGDLTQYLDQIWLTKPDEVKKGENYLINIRFNRKVREISSLLITLVNTASAPPLEELNSSQSGLSLADRLEQAGSIAYSRRVELLPTDTQTAETASDDEASTIPNTLTKDHYLYLPFLLNKWTVNLDEYTHLENWPTGNMVTGDYYVCVTVDDAYNQVEWCSEAFVRVKP